MRAEWLRNAAGAVVAGLLLFASFPPRPLWFLAVAGIALLDAGAAQRSFAARRVRLRTRRRSRILRPAAAVGRDLRRPGAVARARHRVRGVRRRCSASSRAWCRRCPGRRCGSPRCGRCASGPARAFRSADSHGAGWHSASPTAGCCPSRRWAGRRCSSFAVALCGTALAALVVAIARRRRGAILGWAALAAVIVVLGLALTTDPARHGLGGARRHGRGDPGQRAAARVWTSTPSAARSSTTTSSAPSNSPTTSTRGSVPQPDLVIWPENASDIDPLRNRDAAAEITEASRADRRADPRRRSAGERRPHHHELRHRLERRRRPGRSPRQADHPAVRRVPATARLLPPLLRVRRPCGLLRPRPRQRRGDRGTGSRSASPPATRSRSTGLSRPPSARAPSS